MQFDISDTLYERTKEIEEKYDVDIEECWTTFYATKYIDAKKVIFDADNLMSLEEKIKNYKKS